MPEITNECWALNQALELEQEGHAFYLKMADRVKSENCRETFLSLAEEEKKHAELISQQINHMETCGIFVRLPGVEPVNIDLDVRLYAPVLDENRDLGEYATEVDAMNRALDTEIRTYDMYRTKAIKTENKAGQEMYMWLANAELTHFNLLMTNYMALTGLGYF